MFKNITVKKKITHDEKINALLDFAYAEYSSAIEMKQAAKLAKQEKVVKGFINHCLDEYNHTSFFLNCLKTIIHNNNLENHRNFLPKQLYYLGFLNENYFLFEKYHLLKFANFIAVNEKQALLLFTNLKKSNLISEVNDLNKLNKIIKDEARHYKETNDDVFFKEYEKLLFDEKRHVSFSRQFTIKNVKSFQRKYWSFKFWILNRFRHIVARNKKINSFFYYSVSILIVILTYPLKNALLIKKEINVIDFSLENSRRIL